MPSKKWCRRSGCKSATSRGIQTAPMPGHTCAFAGSFPKCSNVHSWAATSQALYAALCRVNGRVSATQSRTFLICFFLGLVQQILQSQRTGSFQPMSEGSLQLRATSTLGSCSRSANTVDGPVRGKFSSRSFGRITQGWDKRLGLMTYLTSMIASSSDCWSSGSVSSTSQRSLVT